MEIMILFVVKVCLVNLLTDSFIIKFLYIYYGDDNGDMA